MYASSTSVCLRWTLGLLWLRGSAYSAVGIVLLYTTSLVLGICTHRFGDLGFPIASSGLQAVNCQDLIKEVMKKKLSIDKGKIEKIMFFAGS